MSAALVACMVCLTSARCRSLICIWGLPLEAWLLLLLLLLLFEALLLVGLQLVDAWHDALAQLDMAAEGTAGLSRAGFGACLSACSCSLGTRPSRRTTYLPKLRHDLWFSPSTSCIFDSSALAWEMD